MSDPSHDDDGAAAAVRAIQAGGDPDRHFAAVFDRFYAPLYHFFRNWGFSDAEADDLTQVALIRVFKGVREFRFESSLETWIFRIGQHVWINAVRDRRAGKRDGREISLDAPQGEAGEGDGTLEPPAAGLDPETAAILEEQGRAVEAALAALPSRMRAVVELRVVGHAYAEIAAALAISVETVRKQLKDARRRLRPALARHFGDVDFEG